MKPRTCSDKCAAIKPLRAVIAVGDATIGSVVIVAVRAIRSRSNFYGGLSRCFRRRCRKQKSSNSRQHHNLETTHSVLLAGVRDVTSYPTVIDISWLNLKSLSNNAQLLSASPCVVFTTAAATSSRLKEGASGVRSHPDRKEPRSG